MKEISDAQIDQYLDIIAGSRLVFYSKKELGEAIGFKSLESHSFTGHLTPEIKRGYFHSICRLADLKMDGTRLFETLLELYIDTSNHYNDFLRRSNVLRLERKENLLDLMCFISGVHAPVSKRRINSTFERIARLNVRFEIILLLIIKSIRPYDYKGGDVNEEEARNEYWNAINFLRYVESEMDVRMEAIDQLVERVSGDISNMSRVFLIYKVALCVEQFRDAVCPDKRIEFRKGYFGMLGKIKDKKFFIGVEPGTVFYEFRDGWLIEYSANISSRTVSRTIFYFRISPGIDRCSYQEILMIHPTAIGNIISNEPYTRLKFTADYITDNLEDMSWIRMEPHPSRDVTWFRHRVLRHADSSQGAEFERILRKFDMIDRFPENRAIVRDIPIFALTADATVFDFRGINGKGFLKVPNAVSSSLCDLKMSSPCLYICYDGKEYLRFVHEDLTMCISPGCAALPHILYSEHPL